MHACVFLAAYLSIATLSLSQLSSAQLSCLFCFMRIGQSIALLGYAAVSEHTPCVVCASSWRLLLLQGSEVSLPTARPRSQSLPVSSQLLALISVGSILLLGLGP